MVAAGQDCCQAAVHGGNAAGSPQLKITWLLRCTAAVLQDCWFAGVLGCCAAGLQRSVDASMQGFEPQGYL